MTFVTTQTISTVSTTVHQQLTTSTTVHHSSSVKTTTTSDNSITQPQLRQGALTFTIIIVTMLVSLSAVVII